MLICTPTREEWKMILMIMQYYMFYCFLRLFLRANNLVNSKSTVWFPEVDESEIYLTFDIFYYFELFFGSRFTFFTMTGFYFSFSRKRILFYECMIYSPSSSPIQQLTLVIWSLTRTQISFITFEFDNKVVRLSLSKFKFLREPNVLNF